VADAPQRDQGVRPARRKLVNRHDRGGAPATVPGTHATEGPEIRLHTNAAITENLAYYPQHGYTETHRTQQDGFHRVFFRKRVDT
jgi:hypothetical protein